MKSNPFVVVAFVGVVAFAFIVGILYSAATTPTQPKVDAVDLYQVQQFSQMQYLQTSQRFDDLQRHVDRMTEAVISQPQPQQAQDNTPIIAALLVVAGLAVWAIIDARQTNKEWRETLIALLGNPPPRETIVVHQPQRARLPQPSEHDD